MNFVTVAELNADILNGLYKIPRDIDLIVGIPRSGMLVASIIALYMNKPLADIDGFIKGEFFTSGKTKNTNNNISTFDEIHSVLIVEDSSSSGNSVREAKKKLVDVFPYIKKLFFAAYVTNDSKENVDIWLRIIENRVFEWNYMHNKILHSSCVDIDGILCIDPTSEENDDGDKYISFIRNAKPKYIPSKKIGYIVTSRLEKYRVETEKWLEKNGIEYGQLIMLDGMTAEERRKTGHHGVFKGEVYKSLPSARLFIESDPRQAREISEITKKAVFCPEGGLFIKESRLNNFRNNWKRETFQIVYNIVRRLPGYNHWKYALKRVIKR